MFISWSGERSKKLAEGLRDWLKAVVQAADPWMSSLDIGAGERWAHEVGDALEEAQFGIICVTRSNQHAPWILFEAGAVAKSVRQGRVVPLLFDLPKSELRHPLALFQAVLADKEGILDLIEAVNKSLAEFEQSLDTIILHRVFDWSWEDFEKLLDAVGAIEDLPAARAEVSSHGHGEAAALEERVRQLETRLAQRAPDAQDQRRLEREKIKDPETFTRGKLWPVGRKLRVAFIGGTEESRNEVRQRSRLNGLSTPI